MICRNVLLRGQEKKITCLWTPVCDKGVSCYTGRDHKISAVQLSSIPRPFWLSRTCRKDGSIILKQRQCESSCFELFDFISPKMDFYKQMKLALLCLVWMVTLTSGFHIKPNASARRAVTRQISSGSPQLSVVSNPSQRRRTYGSSSQRTLQPSSRQWNARRIPASTRSKYSRALMAKLPPLRRTVQKPVTRRKIVESSRRATNTQKSAQRAKKPVKDRDYTFHVVLLADVLCQMCDSLQGEWRANCREQRCARADNSWDENRFLCRNNLQIALKCKSIVCVCIVSKSFGDHLRAVVLT